MNGQKVDEYEAISLRSVMVFSLSTGSTIELAKGERVRIAVNQYDNAYIDDQYVGDASRFERVDEAGGGS